MTVAVTGAAGHVGANLVRALLAQGRSVRALDLRDGRALDGLDVELIEVDVRDPDVLSRAFDGAEVVYHLASYISLFTNEWPLLESINVVGVRNVVEACLRRGVRRLVHFSSIHALTQEPLDVPIDESRPLVESRRYPPYDRSKAAGELEVCRGVERGLNAVIVNPTGILGPHDYGPSHFGEALLGLAHRRLPVLTAGGFNWVDVRDVVEGAMRAEERAPSGAKYILSGHWVSMRDVAAMVAQITGVPSPRFVCPMWLTRMSAPLATAFARLRGKRPLYSSASLSALRGNRNVSHERATRELDYHPRPFRETLIDALRWFEQTGQLARPLALPSSAST